MPKIRSRGVTSGGAAAPSSIVTNIAWLALALGMAATVHAVEGIVQIARDMVRSETHGAQAAGGAHAGSSEMPSHEAAGWVLIAACAVAVGGISHAVADLAETARQILRPKPHLS